MMILWCASAGLVMGCWLNWLADYLPRFAADRSAQKQFELHPKFASALASLLITLVFRKNQRNPVARLNLAVELLMAFLFAFAWVRFGWSPNFFLLAFADAFFVLIALIDLKYRLILNVLVFPAMVAAVGLPFVASGVNLLAVLGGGAFGLVIFWLAARVRPGELGFGDIKLAALIGLILGFPYAVWALLIGVLTGGIAVIVLLFAHGANLKTRIPYAPFLCLGALTTLAFAPLLTFR